MHRFTYPIYKKLFNFDLDDSDEKHKVCNHTLQHSHATHAVVHNDIFLVQNLINHKDINMTLRYVKADEEKKVAAVAKMFWWLLSREIYTNGFINKVYEK